MKALELSAVSHFMLRHEKFIFNFLSSCVDNSQEKNKKGLKARAYALEGRFFAVNVHKQAQRLIALFARL